jgi:SagB-type dehydrogenase family enzyme
LPVSRKIQAYRAPAAGTAKSGKPPALHTSRFVVSYWRDGRLVFHNFLTQRQISANPLTTTILDFFTRWRPLEDLCAALPQYTPASLRRAVRLLVQHSMLERYDSPPIVRAQELEKWNHWNPAAGFFHLSTKDLTFENDLEAEFRGLVRKSKTQPILLPVKHYRGVPRVKLEAASADSEFPGVLLSRRTWRKFSSRPVELSALGKVLGLTFGIQKWVDLPKIGKIALKTSPSGGALHPVECYVMARNVSGLSAGVYHYEAASHSLELLHRGAPSRAIVKLLADQAWYGNAAFVVFMSGVFARTQWKYDYARAYRAVLMEAGHLCQTFCLTATWLGLAPFCTIAFADSKIEKLLRLDGISESVLYVAGAGARPERSRHANLLSDT